MFELFSWSNMTLESDKGAGRVSSCSACLSSSLTQTGLGWVGTCTLQTLNCCLNISRQSRDICICQFLLCLHPVSAVHTHRTQFRAKKDLKERQVILGSHFFEIYLSNIERKLLKEMKYKFMGGVSWNTWTVGQIFFSSWSRTLFNSISVIPPLSLLCSLGKGGCNRWCQNTCIAKISFTPHPRILAHNDKNE